MPLDVLGCTRNTLKEGARLDAPGPETGAGKRISLLRDRDWALQLRLTNEECLVSAGHQPVPIESLPFVHTARRYLRIEVW